MLRIKKVPVWMGIFVSLIFITLFFYTNQGSEQLLYNVQKDDQGLIAGDQYTPEHCIIAFDLHKVLFGQNFLRIIRKLITKNPKLLVYLFYPSFVKELGTLLKLVKDPSKGVTIERLFEAIAQAYPDQFGSLKQDLITILNEEPIYQDTVAIAQALKKMGYTLFLVSNIAPETWQDLIHKYPMFHELFDDRIFMPTVANGFIRKPDPVFYQKFKEYLSVCNVDNKNILFIDDSKKNILVACHDGTGIVFTSAQDLQKQLATLGIEPSFDSSHEILAFL